MKESLLLSDFLLECRGTIQRMKLRCRTNRSNQNEIFDWIRSLNTEEVNEILLVPNHLFNKCKLQTILTELEVVQRVSMPKSVLFCHGTNGCIRSESTVFPDEFYPFKLFEKELMRHIGFTMKSSNDAGGSLFVDSTLHRDRSKLISILNELSLHCAFSKEPTLGCNDASWFDSLSVFTIGQYIVNIIEVRIWDLWHRRQHLNTTTRNIMNEKPNNNNFLKLELVCSSPEYYSILCRSVQSTLQELLLSKDHQKHLMIAQTSRNRHFPFNASIMKLSHCATKLWFLEYMTENSNSISSFVTVIKFYYGANDDGSSSSRMRKLLCLPLRQVMTPLHEFRAILLERLEVEGNKLLQDQLIAEESMGGDSTHIANTACSTKKKKQKQRKKGKTDKLTNTTITTTEITPTNSVTHVPSTNANAVSSFMRSSELSEEHLIQSKRNIFIGQIIDTIIENTFQVLNSKEHMNEPVTYTTTAEDDITAPVTSSTIETDTDIEPLVLHVAEVEDSPNKSQLESTQLQQEQQQQRSIVGYPPSIYSTDVPWYSIQPPPPQDFQSTLLFTFDPMHPFSSSYAHPLQAYNHFQQYSGNFPDMSVQYNPVSVMPLTDTENESAWEFDLQQLIEEDENESYVSIAKHCESVTSQDSLDVDVEVEGIKVQEQLEKSIQIPSSPKSSVIASIATVPYPPVSPKNSSGHHTEEPVITASHEISCMKESIRELLVHSTFSDCSRTCLLNQMAVYRGVMSNFSAPSAVQSVPSMVFHQPEGMSQYRSRAKSYQIDAAAAAKQSKHGRSGSVSEVQSPNLSMQQIEHRFEAMSDAGDGDHNASSVQKEMPHLTRSHSIGHHLSVKALLPLQPLTMRESSRPTVSHVGTTSIKRRSSLNTAKAVPITATKQVSLSTEMSNNGNNI